MLAFYSPIIASRNRKMSMPVKGVLRSWSKVDFRKASNLFFQR